MRGLGAEVCTSAPNSSREHIKTYKHKRAYTHNHNSISTYQRESLGTLSGPKNQGNRPQGDQRGRAHQGDLQAGVDPLIGCRVVMIGERGGRSYLTGANPAEATSRIMRQVQ